MTWSVATPRCDAPFSISCRTVCSTPPTAPNGGSGLRKRRAPQKWRKSSYVPSMRWTTIQADAVQRTELEKTDRRVALDLLDEGDFPGEVVTCVLLEARLMVV